VKSLFSSLHLTASAGNIPGTETQSLRQVRYIAHFPESILSTQSFDFYGMVFGQNFADCTAQTADHIVVFGRHHRIGFLDGF
jgi:hypothetical protein